MFLTFVRACRTSLEWRTPLFHPQGHDSYNSRQEEVILLRRTCSLRSLRDRTLLKKRAASCISHTLKECVRYHTLISNLVCSILYHTLFHSNFGECVGHSKFECVGQLFRESQSGKGYAMELFLLQSRQENIRAMMATGQGSLSAPLAVSNSVNCVCASSL